MGAYGKLQMNLISKVSTHEGSRVINTRHNVSGIELIVIFNEAEAIHQFDLRDFTRSMAAEVLFNV